jgi:ParB family chromosome partitioning protein
MRRALGKGLSQLLGEEAEQGSRNTVPIEAVVANRRQPRKQFSEESIAELADSIREYGVIQPLIVRPLSEGQYELIAGERRLRAAKKAGLTEVPAVVRAANSQASLEMALIENVQREDITAIECAQAYKLLMEEFDLSQDQVAKKVGKSRVSISNTLRILRLPKEVQQALSERLITEGHARAILMVEGLGPQLALLKKILDQNLSVRAAEKLAKKDEDPTPVEPEPEPKPRQETNEDPNVTALQESLSVYFGSPTRVVSGDQGGKIEIDYYSDEDLQRILDILGMQL